MTAIPTAAAAEPGIVDVVPVCSLDRLVPERGAAALVDDQQVALFRIDREGRADVHAIDHRDPFTRANVLARGIVGSVDGRWYVASPLHKQRFDLLTGVCLDDELVTVRVYRTRVVDGIVHVER